MIYDIHKDTMQMPDRTMALSTGVIATPDSVANPNAINQSQTFVDVEMTISKSLSWKTEVHVLSRAKREISCVIRVVEITAHRLFYPFHGHRQRFLTSAFVTFCGFVIFHRCCIISRSGYPGIIDTNFNKFHDELNSCLNLMERECRI